MVPEGKRYIDCGSVAVIRPIAIDALVQQEHRTLIKLTIWQIQGTRSRLSKGSEHRAARERITSWPSCNAVDGDMHHGPQPKAAL